ncbi:MAG: DNA polymerase IV [Proteobacteria bacterium]|nr:DNA polymerase IV [Pseudomonadota bacterium]MBI3495785.1 DNA polymerase IV [Pseudomonadota bacterium]
MTALCRDCGRLDDQPTGRCSSCGSPRAIVHCELGRLSIAHIDCDAFYASCEKQRHPDLADRPVIVGGRHRGVVLACCYVARIYGVRSAMPMFKALKACPEAVVIPPDMDHYQDVGHRVRRMMETTTPLVEPLSIDEAFLDMTGTVEVHGGIPARTLALLALKIEREIGITVSIGLSYNKFLAKVASDLDKPRGFGVIGREEARSFLAPRPVGLIWGVGEKLRRRLAGDGIATIGQLQDREEEDLARRYGSIGRRLARFARGIDDRQVVADRETKSISVETTFDEDIAEMAELSRRLWHLAERLSHRLKEAELAGSVVTLKLKTDGFRIITRQHRLEAPSQLADTLYRAALPLLERAADGARYRLIGIGTDDMQPADAADPPSLFDAAQAKRARAEQTMDVLRAKHGDGAIGKGRGLAPPTRFRR